MKFRVTPDGGISKLISEKFVSEISQDDVEYAVAWVMSQSPTRSSAENARRKLVHLEPTLATQPLIDLSRNIRGKSRQGVDSLFESRLRNAIFKLETSLQEQTNSYIRKKRFPSRSWRTERGKTSVVGQFESLFAGRVRIRLFNGFQMLDLADLSPDDRAYVKQATKSTISNSEQLKLQREARLALVAKGLVDFRSLEKPLKPLGLVTDGGKLALSWRVMILPWLGGGDLFELFRLDEPWNSEHNLKLLNYVPPIYKLDASQSEGTAAIVRFTGIGTASSPTRLVTQEEITYPGKTLLATLVKPEHAVPWTKPQDLMASSSGIAQKIMLFDSKALVLNCDGSLHWLKEGFSDKQLSRAAVRLR